MEIRKLFNLLDDILFFSLSDYLHISALLDHSLTLLNFILDF